MYIREGEYKVIFPRVHIRSTSHFCMQRIVERIFVVGLYDPEEKILVVNGGDMFEGQGVVGGVIESDRLEFLAIDPVLYLSVCGRKQFLSRFIEIVKKNAVVFEEWVFRHDRCFYPIRKEQGAI